MGLDMYLNARRHIWTNDKELSDGIQKLMPELDGMQGSYGGAPVISNITVEAGYWRKANAIHNWFVDNVQDESDDCGYYECSRKQLSELRGLCQRVLDFKHMANELLPTSEGFFFGSTDYGEHYFSSIETTIKIVDRVLLLPDSWDFEYHSSW